MFRAIRLLLITAFIDPIEEDLVTRLELLREYSQAAYERIQCIVEMAPLRAAPTANEFLRFLFELDDHLIVLQLIYHEEALWMFLPELIAICHQIIVEKFTGNIRRRWMSWARNHNVMDESLIVPNIVRFLRLQFAIQWHNEQPCYRSKVIVMDISWPPVKDGWPIVIYLKHTCRCTRLTEAAAAALASSSSSSASSSSSGSVPTGATTNAPDAAGATRRHGEASTSMEPRSQRASWAPWTAPWPASRMAPPTPPLSPLMPSTSSGRSSHRNYNMSTRARCQWCQDERHRIYNCPEMLSMDTTDRWRIVHRLQLCPICLTNHGFQMCMSAAHCEMCHMDHNTLLHVEEDPDTIDCVRVVSRNLERLNLRHDDRDSNNGDSNNGDSNNGDNNNGDSDNGDSNYGGSNDSYPHAQ